MKLPLSLIAQITSGRLSPAAAAQITVEAAGIDSRCLPPRALFIALPGASQDGHDYLPAAAQAGAAAAVVTRMLECPLPQIVVADTLAALWDIARYCRGQYRKAVAAITGSNGKTTVKEMLYSIAAAQFGKERVLCSHGNFNNHLGVPLTLLKLDPLHQLAVIEAGMDHAGELTRLSALIQPQVALINNAQRAHIGNFASLRAIAQAKAELLTGLAEEGCAVLNADDAHFPLWREAAATRRVISFGKSAQADISADFSEDGIILDGKAIRLSVLGEHNKMNALAAAAMAHALQLSPSAVVDGLTAYRGIKGRLAPHRVSERIFVIDDSYNANPESAAAALSVLIKTAEHQAAAPLMIMGDMLALGDAADRQHQQLIDSCTAHKVQLLGMGQHMRSALMARNQPAQYCDSQEALIAQVKQLARQQRLCILIKGSRGMRMENISQAIINTFAGAMQGNG